MTEHRPKDTDVIEIGPVAPSIGGMVYQITLESGAIVTSPVGFPQEAKSGVSGAIVTADGRVLAVPPESGQDEESEFEKFTNAMKVILAMPKPS